jgi:HPt (histidine-containing phosphotransfer) domain-containing protein
VRIPESEEKPGEPWDQAQALANAGGDAALLHEIVAVHLRQCPKLLEQLLEATAAQDWAAVHRTAHSLKGELLCLGATSAARAANDIELHARKSNSAECESRVPGFIAELQRVRAVLERFNSTAVIGQS